VKVFALSFALGVVSGVTMSFQFAIEWPGFLESADKIAGPLLACSFWPCVVTERLTIFEAASAPELLIIILVGALAVLPMIRFRTVFYGASLVARSGR